MRARSPDDPLWARAQAQRPDLFDDKGKLIEGAPVALGKTVGAAPGAVAVEAKSFVSQGPVQTPEAFRKRLGATLGESGPERDYYKKFGLPLIAEGGLVYFETQRLDLTPALDRIDADTGERFRSLPSMTYTPDFMFVRDFISFHEIKGEYVREDAEQKFKMAVAAYPFYIWVWAQQGADGKWERKFVSARMW